MSLAWLLAAGSKIWLDGVAPDEVAKNRALGITGVTSNPVIVANIIEQGQFDLARGRASRPGTVGRGRPGS